MTIVITLTIMIVGWHAGMAVVRLTVDAIATAIGVVLEVRVANVRRRIIAMRNEVETAALDFDRRPSRAERRLMATELKLTIRQTEFRSLLPLTASRAERIAAAWGC